MWKEKLILNVLNINQFRDFTTKNYIYGLLLLLLLILKRKNIYIVIAHPIHMCPF